MERGGITDKGKHFCDTCIPTGVKHVHRVRSCTGTITYTIVLFTSAHMLHQNGMGHIRSKQHSVINLFMLLSQLQSDVSDATSHSQLSDFLA